MPDERTRPGADGTAGERGPGRLGFWLAIGGTWLVMAVIAWLTPPQGDDWGHLEWARNATPASLLHLLAGSRTTGDLVGPALALWRPLHIVASPLVIVALLAGMTTHALGRLPRAGRSSDTLVFLAAGAALWLAAPNLGVVLSHRSYLATYVYGLTAMVWLLAAYRLAGAPTRRAWLWTAGAAVLGLLAGASTRAVGTVGVVIIVTAVVRRSRRGEGVPGWMWAGALAVCAGAVLAWLDMPYANLGRLSLARIDGNLGILYEYVGQNGQVVSALAVALLALLVRAGFGGAKPSVPGLEALVLVRRALLVWAALALIGVVGPVWGTPAKLAAAVALSTAALVAVDAIAQGLASSARSRWLRRLLWIAVLVPAVDVVASGLPRYVDARAQHEARVRTLAAAPLGGVAKVAPSRPVNGDFWVAAESWPRSRLREQVARSLFGIDDIVIDPAFRDYEPGSGFTFEVQAGAAAPHSWLDLPHDLLLARRAFDRGVRELAAATPAPAALVLTNVDFPERAGRPLLAARLVDGRVEQPAASHGGPDRDGRYFVRLKPRSPGSALAEQWFVSGGRSTLPMVRNGRLELVGWQAGWYVLVACDASVCWAVDAFYVPA